MAKYNFFPTPEFTAKLARVEKSDPQGHTRILTVIDRLLERPGAADGWMHGAHHRRLKKYVGRSHYRLIYHWCELCRKENQKLEDHCGFCRQVDDHSVIFFDLYHKNAASRL